MSFRCNKRRFAATAGLTSLELALTFGIFIMLTFGIIDMVRYFSAQQSLTVLANAAARACLATTCNVSKTWSGVAFYAPLLDPNNVRSLTARTAFYGANSSGRQLTVTATYQFTSITPGLDALTSLMSATVTYIYYPG